MLFTARKDSLAVNDTWNFEYGFFSFDKGFLQEPALIRTWGIRELNESSVSNDFIIEWANMGNSHLQRWLAQGKEKWTLSVLTELFVVMIKFNS